MRTAIKHCQHQRERASEREGSGDRRAIMFELDMVSVNRKEYFLINIHYDFIGCTAGCLLWGEQSLHERFQSGAT